MDTRFWGPSAWQLFHLISFRSVNPQVLLGMIKDILPCKFCRESTAEFMKELPLEGDPAKWLYELHNKVNHKLRTQCKNDPNVIDPGPNPSFDEVRSFYQKLKPSSSVPGRDFLFSIAANSDEILDPSQIALQHRFLQNLYEVFPFSSLRKEFQKYYNSIPPKLITRTDYMKWMYGLLKSLSDKIDADMPSYRRYVQRVMYYKSGCSKKTYKGKTCRRTATGHLTKNRDNAKTYRVSHNSLLKP